MAIKLRYGRTVPTADDPGVQIFEELEKNVRISDSHDHDGVNSSLIKTHTLSKTTQDVVVDENSEDFTQGRKRVLVTLPEGYFTDLVHIDVRDERKDKIFGDIEFVSHNSFYFITNTLGTYTFIYN